MISHKNSVKCQIAVLIYRRENVIWKMNVKFLRMQKRSETIINNIDVVCKNTVEQCKRI